MAEPSEAPRRDNREARYRKVRDREPLETLGNGLVIVRATKHEPINLDGLDREQLKAKTNKESGSKFAADWDLVSYVDWIALVVRVLRWDRSTRPAKHSFRLPKPVGVSKGEACRTIEVVFDGSNLHAYPVEDR